MSKHSFRALYAFALLCGCGTAVDETTVETRGAADGSIVRADETILAEIDVGYGVVRFSEVVSPDGSHFISLAEHAPADIARTPMDELLANYGALTSFETYRAILPDSDAPPALVDAHGEEAMGLGRSSDSFVEAVFDPTIRLEKSEAGCRAWVYANPGTPGDWVDRRITLFNATFGSKWLSHSDFMTNRAVTMGVCNESPLNILGRRCWGTNPADAFDLTCEADVTVAGHQMWRWHNYVVRSSSGTALTARHLVEAESPTVNPRQFYLATAYRFACTSNSQCASGQICNTSGVCQWNIN